VANQGLAVPLYFYVSALRLPWSGCVCRQARVQARRSFGEVIPIALVAAAVSTASGIRDQETDLATEAVFLDGANNHVLAQVVRKGTGKPLENESQVVKADDVKGVVDGWASDLHQSYLKLKSK
jgi:hypothetical protein